MNHEKAVLHRLDVLQEIINRINARTYLEIGVRKGATFLRIRARHKLAVDPEFRIARRDKIRLTLTNRTNIRSQYYRMTSDEFFRETKTVLTRHGLDVVFVDGLHTYAQS